MKQVILIISIIITAGFMGCSQPMAKGADDELIILASQEDRKAVTVILSKIFTDTLYTPAPEPYYKATIVQPEEMGRIKHHPNIIAVSVNADLTNGGTRLVKRILPPDVYEKSKRGEQPFILSTNPYADLQTLLVISGESEKELIQSAMEDGHWIYSHFENQFTQRQSRFLFKRARKEELEESIFIKHNFGLKIPWGFTVVQDSIEAKIFWIGKEQPFRWLVVHWEDGMVISDKEKVEEYAKEFPKQIFKYIQYTDYRFSVSPHLFNNWSGWRITGMWESMEEPQGGPFIAYAFYDGLTDRTFYIHTLIYNPGKDKYLLLRQLDIIAHSFYVEE